MLKFFLVANLMLFSVFSAQAQNSKVYLPDSLTTTAAIPRGAVKIPPGRPSGPSARLQYALYANVRFPRTALTSNTSGKIIVHGVVEASGLFRIDSASLMKEQAAIVMQDSEASLVKEDILLGRVRDFAPNKKSVKVMDFPKKWTVAQEDLVVEALRLCYALPQFKPGTLAGEKVASYLDLPVVFKHKGSIRRNK